MASPACGPSTRSRRRQRWECIKAGPPPRLPGVRGRRIPDRRTSLAELNLLRDGRRRSHVARPENELGEEVSVSVGKNVTQFSIGSMAGVGGGLMGLLFGLHVVTTPNNGDLPRPLTVLLGLLCSLFSLALMAVGADTLVVAVRDLWSADRLYLV